MRLFFDKLFFAFNSPPQNQIIKICIFSLSLVVSIKFCEEEQFVVKKLIIMIILQLIPNKVLNKLRFFLFK